MMRVQRIGFAALLMGCVVLGGCGSTEDAGGWRGQDASAQRDWSAGAVVEVSELRSAMRAGGDDLVVFDVRPEADYGAGHLPGAVRIDYGEWEAMSLASETGLTHDEMWRERIGSFGVDGDDTVLIYDDGRMTRAARVWFILQHFGVAEARVVNGGFPLIREEADAGGLALSTRPETARRVAFEPVGANAGRIGSLDRFAVLEAIEAGEAQVLDARTVEEYRGIDLRKNARGGHLPTARNVPHAVLLDGRGRLKPADELGMILDEAGFVKGRAVITHCDGGGRAALAALAAARAGYGPVVNYYLSFGDWAKDARCPVVMP